jgi:hypothetical protein
VFGKLSKATTPLDFILDLPNNDVALCFLSAGGSNPDVISAWKQAVGHDFSHFFAVVMRENSKIARLCEGSSGYVFGYLLPSGRDGFLATNTMIASAMVLFRAYSDHFGTYGNAAMIDSQTRAPDVDADLLQKRDWLVLSGGWGWPAAIDLESKCSEAALKHVLLSDYRSFAHGRHLWLDKEKGDCAVIAVATPQEMSLVTKTLSVIPSGIPRTTICSDQSGPLGAIELFHSVLLLIERLGRLIIRDPGRPGVPSFGSRLYHLGPSGVSLQKQTTEEVWIKRKARSMGLDERGAGGLRQPLGTFLSKIETTMYSGVVLDYDGTLCDPAARFDKLSDAMARELNRLLKGGIRLGIATGRGKSATGRLREIIGPEHRSLVTVGYYNGACLLNLSEDIAAFVGFSNKDLEEAASILSRYFSGRMECNPFQITITPERSDLYLLVPTIRSLISDFKNLSVTRSSHSIDIRLNSCTKLLVYDDLLEGGDVLTIGDNGGVGGNDEDLLSSPYSLSCYEPTVSPDTGWHLAPAGCHFSSAAMFYLSCLMVEPHGKATLSIKRANHE